MEEEVGEELGEEEKEDVEIHIIMYSTVHTVYVVQPSTCTFNVDVALDGIK